MFSLKRHARKNSRVVALGAAAASVACITSSAVAYQYDTVYWDPTLTAAGTGSGGAGTFDNTTANFYNPARDPTRLIFAAHTS